MRTDSGNRITKSRIHEYLRDPFYIGINRWNGVGYPGNQEPLISEQLFNAVQTVLTGKTTLKLTKHNFLFKGLIYCAECGGLITWEPPHKGHYYGHCNHYRNCTRKKWTEEPKVEKQLIEYFAKLEVKSPRLTEWIKKALKDSHKDEIAYHESTIGEVNRQRDILKRRLDKIYDDRVDGKITEEFYQHKFKQYSDELRVIDRATKNHTEATIKYFELGINIYELSQNAVAIYKKADIDQKRMLIRLVFERLTLDEKILDAKYNKAFQVLHDAVVATNSTKVNDFTENTDKIFVPIKKPDTKGQSGAFYPHQPIWLTKWDSFRTANWPEILVDPQFTLNQTQQLLRLTN